MAKEIGRDHSLLGAQEEDAHSVKVLKRSIKSKLEDIAPLLWHESYDELLRDERSQLAEMGLLGEALRLKQSAPPSTYTARGK